MKTYGPINPKFPHFLHGGDYNPDQWKHMKEIWDEDMRLMKLAGCNTMSVGIFSWTALEPEEGRFTFDWLDEIMDKLAANNAYAVLATPSGARPAWMSQKYTEVLRVDSSRHRNLHGARHNHCFTSPVYREKVKIMNTKLAERYKDHPALLVWHLSNEYGGECHCDLCQDAFREWLKKKYDNDLDKLNKAWWTTFWSHIYTDWSQLESPSPRGERSVHGLNLDWKRFVTYQTLDFMKHELEPLRAITPNVPATTNMMGTYPGLNYFKMSPSLDVVSWDSYPLWHGEKKDWDLADDIAFLHDLNRGLKNGKPFMLMESTPSATNWQKVGKLKKPGMHILSSLQAVAHGSDTVQYFQWRKSRGSSEKFHGAVVDHCGHEHNRVFKEVSELGAILAKLDPIIGSGVDASAAIIYDWENRWAIDDMQYLKQGERGYPATCNAHYQALRSAGIAVDVLDMEGDLSGYKLVVAPMLYMTRADIAGKISAFVKEGGTFVGTYLTGNVDENDLCHLGGFPGPLKEVMGIWAEEIDPLYDHESNAVSFTSGNSLGLTGSYRAVELCELSHAQTAKVLASYEEDFYAGRPAVTVNSYGKGKAYYIAFRSDGTFLKDFYAGVVKETEIKSILEVPVQEGISVMSRTDGEKDYVFVMNFTNEVKTVPLDSREYTRLEGEKPENGKVELKPFGFSILSRKS